MRKLKLWVKGFFGFSRKEANAFLVLLPLMFLLIFSQPAYQYWFVRQSHDYSKERRQLDSLLATMAWPRDSTSDRTEIKPAELSAFDPNQSTKDELIRLGFNQALANRLVNYRLKGGKFLIKRDLNKLYGMDSIFYQKLFPYITLPEKMAKTKPILKLEAKEKPTMVKFNLNEADTSQLIKIYGIGPKLAQRIVAYRAKLGGFISDHQLSEVYGLDSTAARNLFVKSFIAENFQPQQINVNKATEHELAAHPYIKYKLAKAIVAYRMQHGFFGTVADLKKITIVTEESLQKMKPYLVTQ